MNHRGLFVSPKQREANSKWWLERHHVVQRVTVILDADAGTVTFTWNGEPVLDEPLSIGRDEAHFVAVNAHGSGAAVVLDNVVER